VGATVGEKDLDGEVVGPAVTIVGCAVVAGTGLCVTAGGAVGCEVAAGSGENWVGFAVGTESAVGVGACVVG